MLDANNKPLNPERITQDSSVRVPLPNGLAAGKSDYLTFEYEGTLDSADDSPVNKGLRYSAISLLLGWWGIPWGPIWTISTMVSNFRGGKDVTGQVVPAMNEKLKAMAATIPK